MENTRSEYYQKLSGDVKERYDKKIERCVGIDPYTIKEKDLSIIQNDFPEITLLDIGKYLVHSISSYTKKKFSAYKSTEAYKYFESGFVLSMGSKKINDTAILTGKVKHGQKMNLTDLKVWILANMNGEILCAHCTCLSGLSETCSHVGAICYAVSRFWESNETESVTDFLCKWNVPKFKEESMTFARNIQWRDSSVDRSHFVDRSHSVERSDSSKRRSNFLVHCDSLTNFTDAAIDQFIMDCQSDGNDTALGTIVFESERRCTNIRDEVFLASLYSENNRNKSLCELIKIGKSTSLKISTSEVNEICSLTIPRLKSKLRCALKRGRITSSNLKDCYIASISNPPITTINRLINPTKYFKFTQRHQIKNKKKAIEQHFASIEPYHENLKSYECGLIFNQKFPKFVASPDGIVSCDCHGQGCVVTKCLKILEPDVSFDVLTQKPNNMLKNIENEYFMEETHEYFYQVQLQIHVTDLNYCDFTIWSPTHFLIVRVIADPEFWKKTMQKALVFHEQVMMPELLGKFYTKADSVISMEEDEENTYELFELEIELLNSMSDA